MKIYTEISENTWIVSDNKEPTFNKFTIVPFIEGFYKLGPNDKIRLTCDNLNVVIDYVPEKTFNVTIPDMTLSNGVFNFTLFYGNISRQFQLVYGLTPDVLANSLQSQTIIDLQAQIDTLNAKISTMVDADTANSQIADLRSQLSSKNFTITDKDAEIMRLTKIAVDLQVSNNNLQAQVDQFQTQVDQLQTQIDRFRSGYLQFGSVVSTRADNLFTIDNQIKNDITTAVNNSGVTIDNVIGNYNQVLQSFNRGAFVDLVKTYSNAYIVGAKSSLKWHVGSNVTSLNNLLNAINNEIIDRINLRQPTIDAWSQSSDYGQKMYAYGLNDMVTWVRWLSQSWVANALNSVATLNNYVTEVDTQINQIVQSYDSIPFPSPPGTIDGNSLKTHYVYSSQIPSEVNLLLTNFREIISATQG